MRYTRLLLLVLLAFIPSVGLAESCYFHVVGGTPVVPCKSSQPPLLDGDTVLEVSNCRCSPHSWDLNPTFLSCSNMHTLHRKDGTNLVVQNVAGNPALCPDVCPADAKWSGGTGVSGWSGITRYWPDQFSVSPVESSCAKVYGYVIGGEGIRASSLEPGGPHARGMRCFFATFSPPRTGGEYADWDEGETQTVTLQPPCRRQSSCADQDGDGHAAVSCGGDDCRDSNPNIWHGCGLEVTNARATFDPFHIQQLSDYEVNVDEYQREEDIGPAGPDHFFGQLAAEGSKLEVTIDGRTEGAQSAQTALAKQRIELSLLSRSLPTDSWVVKKIATLKMGQECVIAGPPELSAPFRCLYRYAVPFEMRGKEIAFRARPVLEEGASDQYWDGKVVDTNSMGVAQYSIIVAPICHDTDVGKVRLVHLSDSGPTPVDIRPSFGSFRQCYNSLSERAGGELTENDLRYVRQSIAVTESQSKLMWAIKLIFLSDKPDHSSSPLPSLRLAASTLMFADRDVKADSVGKEVTFYGVRYQTDFHLGSLKELWNAAASPLQMVFREKVDTFVGFSRTSEIPLTALPIRTFFQGVLYTLKFEGVNFRQGARGYTVAGTPVIVLNSEMQALTLAHELGHRLGQLADEYSFDDYKKSRKPNNQFPRCCLDKRCGEPWNCDGMPHQDVNTPLPDFKWSPGLAPLYSIMGYGSIYPVVQGNKDYCPLRSFPAGQCKDR